MKTALLDKLFKGFVQATKFITTGGTSSDFVKGDGSLDDTQYVPYTGANQAVDLNTQTFSSAGVNVKNDSVSNIIITRISGSGSYRTLRFPKISNDRLGIVVENSNNSDNQAVSTISFNIRYTNDSITSLVSESNYTMPLSSNIPAYWEDDDYSYISFMSASSWGYYKISAFGQNADKLLDAELLTSTTDETPETGVTFASHSVIAKLSDLDGLASETWVNSNFDNYQSWNLKTNGVQRTTIQSGGNLDLVAGNNILLQYGAGGKVTINSSFNNTEYRAGTGLNLVGTEFSFDTVWGDGRYSLTGHTHTFASLTSKPTTISGYGITDFNSLGDARWALRSRTLTAGNGLSGGGNLTANRTFTLGTPSEITLSSTNSVTTSSHTHAFTPGGTTAQYIRGDGSLATYANTTYSAGTGLSLTGTVFANTAPNATHTGDVTGATALTIANSAVTHAKYQNIATQRILGRGATGTGNVQELTLGSNLSLSTGGVLSATNTNTTYSAGTLALLNTGTNTSNRVWSSKILNDWLVGKNYVTANIINGLASENWVTENFDDYKKWILKTNGNSQWGVESDSFVDFRDSTDIQVIYEADGIVKFELAGGSSGHQNLQGVTNVGNTTTNQIIVHGAGGVNGQRVVIDPKGIDVINSPQEYSGLTPGGLFLTDGAQSISYRVDGIKRITSTTNKSMMFPTDDNLGVKTIPLSVNGAEADPVTGDIDTSNHAPIRPLEVVTFNMCYAGWKNETRFYVKTSTICINISLSDEGKEIVLTNDSGGTVSVAGTSSSFYLVYDGGLPRATVSSFPAQFSGRFRVMNGNFYQIL